MNAAAKPHPLSKQQGQAVAPDRTVWLSASAGTGKTQVLSARVLRLLLQPRVEPSQILCLTFTKAGATEMAGRINDKLAQWVRLGDTELALELQAIGADIGPKSIARARTLFASVLDCPGGGLRIDTIHAFSQWLLGAFPLEANLAPGAKAMEDRERIVLQRQVLSDLLTAAQSEPLSDPQLLTALADLSLRMGPEDTERWLMRCAAARAAWFGPGGWQEPMRPQINQLLGLPADMDQHQLAQMCSDDCFDIAALNRCLAAYRQWGTKTGHEAVSCITNWLSAEPAVRLQLCDDLCKVLFTKEGAVKNANRLLKYDNFFESSGLDVLKCMNAIGDQKALLNLADRLVPALRLGRAFAFAWEEAKQREGYIDFDDQIRMAADLLNNGDYAGWIGYKLDRQFDHILVDEAQDTNAAQWQIIDALTREFFSGLGQRGDVMRTLFVVGDYKQAIFRFQGTSPENFEAAKQRVKTYMRGAAENAAAVRSNMHAPELLDLGLDRSFRTAKPILDFVDQAIGTIGYQEFGLSEAAKQHQGEDRPGHVALWRPVSLFGRDGDDDSAESDEGISEVADHSEGQEAWLSRPDRILADRIARQVRNWLDTGFKLVKGKERAAGPGDIMVLVRKRKDLAGLIVARLHAAGVPVAGVDRLRLGAPLAVKDLVAAMRFAAQPLDDLTLAALLVSPLIGWSQEQLLQHGYRDKHAHLWDHLRRISHPDAAAAMAQLTAVLALADYQPPQALLHWLLVGPWQGRRKLVARLGQEANDPIDELLNAAHAYAASGTPSLVGFLNWFDAGEGELKREPDTAAGLVRVMTVHGAKGLQAPIVILADATGDPESGPGEKVDLADPANPERLIPLPNLSKEERSGRIAAATTEQDRALLQEHWRLLYVAMTRAEEALFIGGALTKKNKGVVPEKSWYAKLQQIFGAREWAADDIWQGQLTWGDPPGTMPVQQRVQQSEMEFQPAWLHAAPLAEPRPPRPLAPSALGEDDVPDPPYPPGSSGAAQRGVIIHRLLERLPGVANDQRQDAGRRWLAKYAPQFSKEEHGHLLAQVLAVIDNPTWSDLFSPDALAEVPIAAVVGEQVIAGTIDRLLITKDHIRLIDFKTARRPPLGLEDVPKALVRQMAAYVAALEVSYPGRKIEAALLYTQTPVLIALPDGVLSPFKITLQAAQ